MLFSVKDAFRAMVEYDSNGRNTVIYDEQGNPNIVVIISRYDMSELGVPELPSGTHPAFIINGEREVDEIFVGKYNPIMGDGNVFISMIGNPAYFKSFCNTDECVQKYIRKKGKGWHAMTSIEWGAIALLSWKLGIETHGNVTMGHSKSINGEIAIPVDDERYDENIIQYTKTGTGPNNWSHDGTSSGIFDLVGGYRTYTPGAINLRGEYMFHGSENTLYNMIDVDDSPNEMDVSGYIHSGIFGNIAQDGSTIIFRNSCTQYGLHDLDDDSRDSKESLERFGKYTAKYIEGVYKDMRESTWESSAPSVNKWHFIAHGIMSPTKDTPAFMYTRIGGKRLMRRGTWLIKSKNYQESIFETHIDQCNRHGLFDQCVLDCLAMPRCVYIP